MADRRKYVIPGDVVTSGPFRPEQNVILEGNIHNFYSSWYF